MKYLYILILFLFGIMMKAQVGINTLSIYNGADFHVENLYNNIGDTIPKGIMIPKLATKQRDQIDVSSTDANSLFIYNIDEDCYNYYSVSNNDWMNLCGELETAQLTSITCDDIEIFGTYVKGVPMNSSNYLKIKVNVLKAGTISISGVTSNDYYFNSQETVPATGSFTITVPAYGTPSDAQTDNLTMSGVGFSSSSVVCTAKINVLEPIGEYSMNCANISVNGTYLKGTELTSSEYIEVSLNVAVLGSYNIKTVQTNGIQFTASGTFTSTGYQTVKLMGSGTPNLNSDFTVSIVTDSEEGQNSCVTTIPILLPSMTYAIIGDPSVNTSWNSSPRNDVLINETNFSKTGTFKINGLNQLWSTNSSSDALNYLNSGYNGSYPDVLLFYSPGITQSADLATALANYLQNGGFVIYGTTDADVTNTNLILSAIFSSSVVAQAQIAGTVTANDVYSVASNSSDPIINGSFSSLSNLGYWGESGNSTNSVIVPSIPTNSVQLVSAANTNGKQTVNPVYSIAWYSPQKNFVYFGNSVGASSTDATSTANPAYYLTNVPNMKSYGGGTAQYVSNSFLELNALGWCLSQAAVIGINPH